MTNYINFETNSLATYTDAEARYDEMMIEVSELSQPVSFRHINACTLIDCFRDGLPVFKGDPRLSDVPF